MAGNQCTGSRWQRHCSRVAAVILTSNCRAALCSAWAGVSTSRPASLTAAVLVATLLPGCASTSGAGKAIGTNGSGNVTFVDSTITVRKTFINCPEAASGLEVASEAASAAAGGLDVNVAAQAGAGQGSTVAEALGELTAADYCGGGDAGASE